MDSFTSKHVFLSTKSQHQQQQMRNTLSHLQVASVTFIEVFFALTPARAKNKRNFFKPKQIEEAHLEVFDFDVVSRFKYNRKRKQK